jgi:[ribosomal protein S18]-alanine N-acetyltransferase
VGTAVSVIRPMRTEDLPAVLALEQAHQLRPWSEKVFGDEMSAEGRVYVVAETGGTVVGFAGVMIVGDEAHITNLLVDPDHRGRGIATDLVGSLVGSSVELGARHMTLEVRTSNVAARRLYGRLGMAPVGVRPRYYGDDDALIMWAHDIDRPEYLESLK